MGHSVSTKQHCRRLLAPDLQKATTQRFFSIFKSQTYIGICKRSIYAYTHSGNASSFRYCTTKENTGKCVKEACLFIIDK